MHRAFNIIRVFLMTALLALLVIVLSGATAQAQTYTKLQVLLPGETAAPGTTSGKTGAPAAQTAGVPFAIRVRACDATWHTVTSITHIVSIQSSDVSASLPSPTQLVAGEAQLTVTLNAGGSFTFTASDETDGTVPDAVSSYVSAMVLQGFRFNTISQKHMYAGVPETYTITAIDPNGDVVSGFSGAVRLREITSYGDGRVSPATVTLASGVWTGQLTMYRADESSINRGNVNAYAYLEANPAKNGTSDPFIVHPGAFARLQIVLPGETPLPGSVTGLVGSPASQAAGQSFAVDVYSTDDYWNLVPSYDAVRVTSSDAGASTPVSGSLSNGYRQFTVSLATVGAQTLTVNDQTNSSIEPMTSAAINVIPSAPDHFAISAIPSPVTAGQSVSVTIRAVDVGGNTIPGYAGNAILFANTGPASISPEAILFTDGVWTGTMVFRGAGSVVSFVCSDFSTPPHTGTSNSFQVLPAAFTKLQVLLPGQTPKGGTVTGYSGEPASQNAGTSFTVIVRAVDQYWNLVPDVNDRVAMSSTDLFASMPAETLLLNGERSFPATLYKRGFQTITAADVTSPDKTSHTSRPVEILSGTYSRILIVAPGETLAPGTETGRSGTATDQSINFAFTVAVYATDAWWNPVTGVSDMINITSNDPMAQLPPAAPLVDGAGAFVVRLSTGGYQQITASNLTTPSMAPSTTQVRAISSGFHLEAVAEPSAVQAGSPFTLTVKVTNDAGSVIQEINSFVTITVQNASTREPGKGTLLTTRFQLLQGQRSISETYTYAESIILTAEDDAGNAPGVTDAIVVSPGPPAAIDLASEPPWVGGYKHAVVSAAVVDAFGNGVPAQPLEFALVSGGGELTQIDTLTDESGVARADYLSPREPQISRVEAVSNAIVAVLDIETALVSPRESNGYITNYPNPFHPGESPTTIAYKLADDANVTLKIYTLTGVPVLTKQYAHGADGGRIGLNEVTWDGRNGKNQSVASGGYVVVVEAEGHGETLHVMRRRVAVVR